MILVAMAFLKSGGCKDFSPGSYCVNRLKLLCSRSGRVYELPYCLIDLELENPSSTSKEYFRYAMREVEVKSLPIFFSRE